MSTIRVPTARPAGYAPSWDAKAPGLRVSCTLDLSDMLAAHGLTLKGAAAELEPPLVADTFDITEAAVSFFIIDSPAAPSSRWRVQFLLTYSDGSQDAIIAWQPIAAAAAADADALTVGGTVITIGGEPISA